MTYPSNLETVYQVRYSTFNNGNVDFIEDANKKWEFESLDEATAIYKKTVESKDHEWVALTKTLKMSEDDFNELYPEEYYPDYEVVDEHQWDEEVCEDCGCCLTDEHYNEVYGNMVCDDCFNADEE